MAITPFFLQELVKDVDEHKPKLEKLKERSNTLTDASEVDEETIDSSVEDVTERYDRLTECVDDRLGKLNKLQDTVRQYKENIKPVEELFEKVEVVITEQPSYGIDGEKIKKEISKIEVRSYRKAIQIDAEAVV